VAGAERLPDLREGLEALAPAEAHAQPSELAGRGAPCVRFGAHELGQRPARAVEERLTGVREPDLPSRARQQIRSELLLQLADRDAERRLRHVQALGGAAEVELLRDRDEIAQVAKLDHLDRDRNPIGTVFPVGGDVVRDGHSGRV
jgi:hypothetical protein